MSTQEGKLKAIADAIRQKEGTTEPIPANDFPARIRALETGGGSSDYAIPLVVTAKQGTTVTAAQGETILTAVADSSGTATVILTAPGDWSVSATLGDITKGPITINAIKKIEHSFLNRLPEGYTEYEYIYLEGKRACIDTEFVPKLSDTKIIMDWMVSDKIDYAQFFCGGSLSTGTYYVGQRNNGQNITYRFTDTAGSLVTVSSDLRGEKVSILLDFPQKSISFGENLYSMGNNIAPSFGKFILFHSSTDGTTQNMSTSSKLYSCKIYSGDSIVSDLVPCTNFAGVTGLYDIIRETFYQKADGLGTGVFFHGPKV